MADIVDLVALLLSREDTHRSKRLWVLNRGAQAWRDKRIRLLQMLGNVDAERLMQWFLDLPHK